MEQFICCNTTWLILLNKLRSQFRIQMMSYVRIVNVSNVSNWAQTNVFQKSIPCGRKQSEFNRVLLKYILNNTSLLYSCPESGSYVPLTEVMTEKSTGFQRQSTLWFHWLLIKNKHNIILGNECQQSVSFCRV